jgi:hypothetical protein
MRQGIKNVLELQIWWQIAESKMKRFFDLMCVFSLEISQTDRQAESPYA